MEVTYLAHHGILGQKWGVRRYQNPDGSLTEAGYRRLRNFKDKSINSNNKYYDRHTSKYSKTETRYTNKASKTTDASKKAKYERLAKSAAENRERAEGTRKSLNDFYENMSYDTASRIDAANRQENARKLKTAAGVAGLAAGAGLLGAGAIGAKMAVAAGAAAIKTMDLNFVMQQAMKYSELGIRAYADVRGFVVGTYLDEALSNYKRTGIAENVGNKAGELSSEVMNAYSRSVGKNVDAVAQATIKDTAANIKAGAALANELLRDPEINQMAINAAAMYGTYQKYK